MTEKQREIMKTLGALVPMLTELEQEKFLSFSEGMAFMLAEQARESTERQAG